MTRRTGVYGANETARSLRAIGAFLATPANEAARFALAPMLAEAKRNAPRKTGKLRKSLVIRRDPKAPKSAPRFFVGPRRESPASRYAHLTEFFNGPNLGWFTAAWESTKAEVLRRYSERLGKAIEARARKIANKVRP